MNPTVVYRGQARGYKQALTNFEALMDGRYEDTMFDRDNSKDGGIRRHIPWIQGKLDLMEEDSEKDIEESERGTGSAG